MSRAKIRGFLEIKCVLAGGGVVGLQNLVGGGGFTWWNVLQEFTGLAVEIYTKPNDNSRINSPNVRVVDVPIILAAAATLAEANQRIPAFHLDRLRLRLRRIAKIRAWVFGGRYRSIMSSLTREMEEMVGCGYTKAPMAKLSVLERWLEHRYADLEKMGAVDSYKTAQQGDLFKGMGQKRGEV